jgi:predicted Zn-dependent protease
MRYGNADTGRMLLAEADSMLKGWLGMYSKLAAAYIIKGDEDKAIAIIKDALQHEKGWNANLPAFYYLAAKHKSYQELINESAFTATDWGAAIQEELNLGKNAEALTLATQMTQRYPASSNLQYLLASALLANGDKGHAKNALSDAIRLDPQNGDAKRMQTREFKPVSKSKHTVAR